MLARFESRNITFRDPEGGWPIVWSRARGACVWDVDDRRFLDLTAAFGVTASGHANPRVVAAAQHQLRRLSHAMGDVHPHPGKAQLVRELSRLTFERWSAPTSPGSDASTRAAAKSSLAESSRHGKTILANSGFEAVEAALKTALLATQRREVIAFEQAYHGLGYGALNVTYRSHFRGPFQPQLRRFTHFLPFPCSPGDLKPLQSSLNRQLGSGRVGAVIAEPIQARGGIRVPPDGFLQVLRESCDRHGALLVLDEIYTGFGRTGTWFACEHEGIIPDLICLGKALTNGFPLAACVGTARLMDSAWPLSTGEAIHTSTFLGHPVGCAMALAQIAEIKRRRLVERARQLGSFLIERLHLLETPRRDVLLQVRGRGLMAGIALVDPKGLPLSTLALQVVKSMLLKGFILLPEGERGEIVSLTPPLVITRNQIHEAVDALQSCLFELESP